MLIPKLFAMFPIGVGLTLLCFLWGAPFNDFHSPPLFFRVFGSFIALFFVLVGISAWPNRQLIEKLKQAQNLAANSLQLPPAGPQNKRPLQLKCPSCGATAAAGNVSPHGDVRCEHCHQWFNTQTSSQ